eukprot:scaffold300318_cov24-Tisochrysis_lutea.AAC.1
MQEVHAACQAPLMLAFCRCTLLATLASLRSFIMQNGNNVRIPAIMCKYKLRSSADTVDIEDVKYHVTRLMRMLVQICQTLEQMPKQVWHGGDKRCLLVLAVS